MPNKNTQKSNIKQAATKLFAENGYLETNLWNIASASKISKGGIYHHYLKKEDILFDILNDFLDQLLGNIELELKNIEGNQAKLEYIISRHILISADHMNKAKVLVRHSYCLPSKKFQIIAKKEKKYYQIVYDVISEFLGKGISKEKLTAITFSLWGICNWTYIWYDPRKGLTPENVAEIFKNVFIDGAKKAVT